MLKRDMRRKEWEKEERRGCRNYREYLEGRKEGRRIQGRKGYKDIRKGRREGYKEG